MAAVRGSDSIRLRPHASLISQGLIAATAFLAPVFLVLYYLTVPDGPWLLIVYVQIAASLVVALAASRYYRAAIWVDETSISERGFFRSKTRFESSQIGSMLFVITLYSSQPLGAPQLFVCDHDGRQLVRMRGRFWSRADMDTVSSTLNAPYVRLGQPMSTSEIHEQYPGIGYWFERRPVVAALVFIASATAIGAVSILVVWLVGPLPGN
ncbi:hypothetical protein IWX81_001847 [Salinibacterium sp. CAN_S4]|uniref:hypothetical protein n=1 Tax=Salinibacterium sp. CAN_S4 TaxID=2787727 RepID=UPI0018F00637